MQCKRSARISFGYMGSLTWIHEINNLTEYSGPLDWCREPLRQLCNAESSKFSNRLQHYDDVTMSAMASQITSLTIVYSIVYSSTDQRNHQNSASLALVRGIHRWPVNSPHKGSVTRKMFPFVVIMRNTIVRPILKIHCKVTGHVRPSNWPVAVAKCHETPSLLVPWERLRVAYSVPSHNLDRRWLIIDWSHGNIFQ